MPFTEKDWKDSPLTTTPISAAALEDMETRLSDYTDERAADASFSIQEYGADPTGSANSASAINSAIAAAVAAGGGVVFAPPGAYKITSNITVSDGISLWGAGNNMDTSGVSATSFECSGSGSGITFTGNEGTSGNFVIDGNSSANIPWKAGLGQGRTFISLDAIFALQDNLWCADVQNAIFLSCNLSNAGRDNLSLDLGSTGNLFSRLEINNPTRHGIRMTQSGAGAYGHPPGMNRFDTCHIEDQAGSSTGDPLRVEFSHYMNEFSHCVFSANGNTTRSAVQLSESAASDIQIGSVILSDCAYNNSNVTAGTKAVSISLNAAGGHKLTFVGHHYLSGYDYLLSDPGTNAGDAVRLAGVHIPLGDLSPDTDPTGYSEIRERIDLVPGSDSQNATIRGLKNDKTGVYWFVQPSGLFAWGPGNNYVPDTFLNRSAAGFLTITNGFTFPALAAASAPNNSLFRDTATGKLAYKDNSGTTNQLY